MSIIDLTSMFLCLFFRLIKDICSIQEWYMVTIGETEQKDIEIVGLYTIQANLCKFESILMQNFKT